MIINGYKITSNHATGVYPANLRVKSAEGVLVARLEARRGDVLDFVRKNPQSEERVKLVAQLQQNDVPEDVIKQIVTMPKGK